MVERVEAKPSALELIDELKREHGGGCADLCIMYPGLLGDKAAGNFRSKQPIQALGIHHGFLQKLLVV